jgi:hypothetical protein
VLTQGEAGAALLFPSSRVPPSRGRALYPPELTDRKSVRILGRVVARFTPCGPAAMAALHEERAAIYSEP